MSTYFENDSKDLNSQSPIEKLVHKFEVYRDRVALFKQERWGAFAFLLFFYVIRVLVIKGFHIVSYFLAIHLLNNFLDFISPHNDPEESSDPSFLPSETNREFKPFNRKLKEVNMWLYSFAAVTIAFLMTFFERFNVKVYWPLLAFYFCILFLFTMRHQINHMIKYNYVPWDTGKKNYDVI